MPRFWGQSREQEGHSKTLTGEEDQVGDLTSQRRVQSSDRKLLARWCRQSSVHLSAGACALLRTEELSVFVQGTCLVLTDLCLDLWSQEVGFPLSLALLLLPGKRRALRRGFC